ncbi:HAD-IA family hydrolase [Candidatus Pacearchaeota archaeon]|nr:HAD-IA family hydrolase [Candidatus Pacearchaeota archaeon]
MIKTIAFDMEGVLVKSGKKSIQESVAKEFGIKIKNWIEIIRPIIRLSSKGRISKRETLARIKEVLNENHKKIENALKEFYKKSYKTNKIMLELSKKLKKRYKIIIMSNLGHLAKEVLVENRNMKHFKNKIISCDIGKSKANKKFFEIALKKSKTKPNEMVFIDNLKINVSTAKELGIKAVLFKNNKQVIKELGKLGVKVT